MSNYKIKFEFSIKSGKCSSYLNNGYWYKPLEDECTGLPFTQNKDAEKAVEFKNFELALIMINELEKNNITYDLNCSVYKLFPIFTMQPDSSIIRTEGLELVYKSQQEEK